MSEETSLWKGRSSQWLNLGPFAFAALVACGIVIGGIFFPPVLALLILPLGWAAWKWLEVRSRVYEVTTERLITTSGVINQRVDEIELYRVKDSQLYRTWWMRLTGLGAIHLLTSDRSMPQLDIPAIKDGTGVREILRRQVESQRDRKRVREMDFDEAGDMDGDLGDAR